MSQQGWSALCCNARANSLEACASSRGSTLRSPGTEADVAAGSLAPSHSSGEPPAAPGADLIRGVQLFLSACGRGSTSWWSAVPQALRPAQRLPDPQPPRKSALRAPGAALRPARVTFAAEEEDEEVKDAQGLRPTRAERRRRNGHEETGVTAKGRQFHALRQITSKDIYAGLPDVTRLSIQNMVIQKWNDTAIKDRKVEVLAQKVLEICFELRVPLCTVETAVLPEWGFCTEFPSRQHFEEWLGIPSDRKVIMDFWFDMCGIRVSDYFCVMSVKWVERLNGTMLTRLMTDPEPTLCDHNWGQPIIDFGFNRGLLNALRRIPWAPEYAWIFPQWHRDRMAFLYWVGDELKLNPAWSSLVMAFLPIDPIKPSTAMSQRWRSLGA